MDRELELRYLAQADEHVSRARLGIAWQERWIRAHSHADPDELLEQQRLLQTMRETLGELLVHRQEVLRKLGAA